jgi:hypothetical protein
MDAAMADEKARNRSKRLELLEKERKRKEMLATRWNKDGKMETDEKEGQAQQLQKIPHRTRSESSDEDGPSSGSDSEAEPPHVADGGAVASGDDSDIDAWGLNEDGQKERIDDRFRRWQSEMRAYCAADTVEALKLDEGRKIGYTFKCIGSGVWALRQPLDNFKLVMTKLVMEGGDADTNGAVAGAMLGARIGYSKLPKDWMDLMPYKPWLEKRLNRLLQYMGLDPSATLSV